ncbi:MAG: DUF1080 domain-containing protein [Armatimonadetes bacterium]|nr:DUF1080 domain-containing protein [Armatimonadota bacterium]MDW8029527.1 DUF1080 domain-containing protein [Armatimonadota bacterium]
MRWLAFSILLLLNLPIHSQILPSESEQDDFMPLFNGKNFDGWDIIGDKDAWQVKDGLIVCTGKGSGWLKTKWEFDDFIFRVEWRIRKGGNSGVFFRSLPVNDPWVNGFEIQILDDGGQVGLTNCGAIYGLAAPKTNPVKSGEWNTYEIRAIGNRIYVYFNGILVHDVDLSANPEMAKRPKFGYIGLQNHGDYVEFRNPIIKELGFKWLFNGKDLSAWKTEGAGEWKILPDGILHYTGKGTHLWTLESFRNFILRLEWRIEKGGDSGIYLRGDTAGRAQVNIWEHQMGSGQIWGYNISPKKRMDAPTGDWNYMEIRMVGNKVSVWLNGEWVIEDAELLGVAPKGPIALQHHGTPLWFRNIRVKTLP